MYLPVLAGNHDARESPRLWKAVLAPAKPLLSKSKVVARGRITHTESLGFRRNDPAGLTPAPNATHVKFLPYICLVVSLLATAGAKPSLTQADHKDWDSILKDFVNTESRVDYSRLKSEAADRLVRYTGQLAAAQGLDWKSPEGKAFLINAYNALTIRWVVENYPATSIMATPNPFRKKRHRLAGETVSLDEIEERLRKSGDARIHAALVCAALSCPPLRREAYVAARLDEQLNSNTRKWLANSYLNEFDPQGGTAELSAIFDWNEKDFSSFAGGLEGFVRDYAPRDKVELLGDRRLAISFKEYRWGLNDQSPIGEDYSGFRLALDWLKNWFR